MDGSIETMYSVMHTWLLHHPNSLHSPHSQSKSFLSWESMQKGVSQDQFNKQNRKTMIRRKPETIKNLPHD